MLNYEQYHHCSTFKIPSFSEIKGLICLLTHPIPSHFIESPTPSCPSFSTFRPCGIPLPAATCNLSTRPSLISVIPALVWNGACILHSRNLPQRYGLTFRTRSSQPEELVLFKTVQRTAFIAVRHNLSVWWDGCGSLFLKSCLKCRDAYASPGCDSLETIWKPWKSTPDLNWCCNLAWSSISLKYRFDLNETKLLMREPKMSRGRG